MTIKSRFDRRRLLQGLGAGALLFSPLVRSGRVAAQAAPAGNFLVFFTPNGQLREFFGGQMSGGALTFKPSLSALAPHASQVSVVEGLCLKSASDKSSHEDITRILTCVSGDDMYRGYGPSIDHAIGRAIDSRPLTLAVEPFIDAPAWNSKLSWLDDGAHDPHVKNPRTVYNDMFAGLTPSQTPEEVDYTVEQNKSVLDFVREDIGTFKSRLGPSDRAKLDLHLEALRQLERSIGPIGTGGNPETCAPDALGSALDVVVPGGNTEKLRQQGELMVDLLSMGFACGVRRVATLQWQLASDGHNPNEGGGNHHEVTHYEAPNSYEQWQQIDAWYAERFAYTIARLDALGILESTVVVWASEISEHHNQNNYVNVVGGGSALGIQLGKHIQYPFYGDEGGLVGTGRDSRNRSMADLWITVQHAMGVNSNSFGDAEYSNGPLTELLSV